MDQVTYVAIVTISLPGVEGTATAHVALAPADTIPVEGGVKPLHECTLADLRAFANDLEAEVWQTYQAIRLIDLAKDEQASVELTVLDATGQPVAPPAEWFHKAVVLPATKSNATGAGVANATETTAERTTEAAGPPEVEQAPEAESVAEAEAAASQEVGPEPAPAALVEPETAGDVVDIIVAEPETVHQERDTETAAVGEPVQDVETEAAPLIVPSKARVRVAGRRRPGDTTGAAVDILIDEPALRATQAHALSSPDREVAGVLVGPRPEKQPDGRYLVHIIDSIIAKYTVMHGASVTYTPESWRYVNDKLAERYPDETAAMVGWYHTHPGFGIFLSGMDLFIHQNFFTQIWHVAFVLDPRVRASGFFCWDRQKSQVSPYDFPWPAWADESW